LNENAIAPATLSHANDHMALRAFDLIQPTRIDLAVRRKRCGEHSSMRNPRPTCFQSRKAVVSDRLVRAVAVWIPFGESQFRRLKFMLRLLRWFAATTLTVGIGLIQ